MSSEDPRTLQQRLVQAVRERWPLLPIAVYSNVLVSSSPLGKPIMLHVAGRNVEEQFVTVLIPWERALDVDFIIEEICVKITSMIEDDEEDE